MYSLDMHSRLRSARSADYDFCLWFLGEHEDVWSTKGTLPTGGFIGVEHYRYSYPCNGYFFVESKGKPGGTVVRHAQQSYNYSGTGSRTLVPWKYALYQGDNSQFHDGGAFIRFYPTFVDGETWKCPYYVSADDGVTYNRVGCYNTHTGSYASGSEWLYAEGLSTDANGWASMNYYDAFQNVYVYFDNDSTNKTITQDYANPPDGCFYFDDTYLTEDPSNKTFSEYIIDAEVSTWQFGSLYIDPWDGYVTALRTMKDIGCINLVEYYTVPVAYHDMYMHVTVKGFSGCVTSKTIQVPPAYQIHYDTHGGSDVASSKLIFTGYSRNVTDVVPTREGYDFLGWYAGENAAGQKYSAGESITLTSDKTLHAAWKPKWKIETSKDGEGTITDSILGIETGASKTISYSPADGWYVDSVTVDGTAVSVDSYPSSYTFSNISGDHRIHVVFKKYWTNIVQIRWRQKDGTWTEYQILEETKYKQHETAPVYTWVRGQLRDEPENVYYDATSSVTSSSDATYGIVLKRTSFDVERKKYSYRFDVNPPSGYAVIGVENRQDDLLDKWAETTSGSVKSPSLTGYTFLGWNTKKDGTGTMYVSEPMLSNQTFYGQWRKNQYYIRYLPNGAYDPDKQPGAFTQTIVTGSMANSRYEYDVTGSLRTNAFVRAGYEFLGWNTKADGTGLAYPNSAYDLTKLYSNGYSRVYNMTTTDGAVLDVYAIWKRKLGTDKLTIVSEETGNPIVGAKLHLYKKVNGSWVQHGSTYITDSKGQLSVSDLEWYDYEWRVTDVPAGYEKNSIGTNGVVSFRINHTNLVQQDTEILYMKKGSLTVTSTVSAIISGERAPSFVYQVSGRDVAGVTHTYTVCTPVLPDMLSGQGMLSGVYAGTYQIMPVGDSRYVLGRVIGEQNVTVLGSTGTADLVTSDRACVWYPYTITQYEGFGSMDTAVNGFASVRMVRLRSAAELFRNLLLD